MNKPIRDYKISKPEQDKAKVEPSVPELLKLKKIQDLWNCIENDEGFASLQK